MTVPQNGQSWERVRLTIDAAGVADVLLDRPPANAIDLVTLVELKQVAEALTADRGVRVVILRSALESIFVAGFDLDLLGHAWGDMRHLIRTFHEVATPGFAFRRDDCHHQRARGRRRL
jgi:enoyl-CoA hydratase/carnithine racemase